MKKLLTIALVPLILLLSSNIFGQETNTSILGIDNSVLENLTPEQIEMAKNQLSDSIIREEPKPITKESTVKITPSADENIIEDDDINVTEIKKYGYDYFSVMPTTVSAVGDLPLPNDYKISLNDQFTVILSGSKESIFDLNVNLDGSILFPEIGSISVVGETFQEVKTKLSNLIDQSYIGVQIDLSLKNLSAKKITIVGAVKTPGTYLVNPFSTISSALGYSGGISQIGTLRNIRLSRNNGETYIFDLYKLLIDGDRSDDITIESGDVIVIDPAEQFIKITGQVRRPAIYEVKKDENLNDLIKYALGLTQIANKTNIDLEVLDIESSSIKKIFTENEEFSLADVLSVNVNPYVSKDISNIRVDGAIKEPGFYSLSDNESLEKIINKLEFIDVYPWLAVLEQFDSDNLVQSTVLFSLKDPSSYRSVKILPNSKLFFADLSSREFDVGPMTQGVIDDYNLVLNHKQGTYSLPVFGKFDVKSFIDYLGLDMSDVENEATYISPLDNTIVKEDYKNMQFVAKKYHTVSFRSPVNNLINVTIQGAVDFPGTYTLNSSSVVSDLYALVGKFKPEAFLEGIIFTRESVRNRQLSAIERSKEDINKAIFMNQQEDGDPVDLSIYKTLEMAIEPENLGRIAGDFSPQSNTSENTVLLDGDSIIVPINPNVVNVLGEVLNPIAFEYTKNITVRSAIQSSGGFGDFANQRKVYIIKANGTIQKASRNIFAGNSRLEPGDTVVVPRKFNTNNSVMRSVLPVTNILSDLAFSAAALDNLSNSN